MNTRFRCRLIVVLAAAALAGNARHAEALGTAFTYQGRLDQDGLPRDGDCDFTFAVFDAAQNGTQAGPTLQKTLTLVDGLFTVGLDFGAPPFGGADRWLQVGVRCPAGSGPFTALPRQQLTPTPYALWAATAGTVAQGTVGTPQLADGAVTSDKIANGGVGVADIGFNFASSASKGGPASDVACAGCVSGAEIGNGQVVKSFNGLTDAVTVQAGPNVTVTPTGNTLTIAAAGGGLASVAHDGTLAGDGTGASPLRLSLPLQGNIGINTASPQATLDVDGVIRVSGGTPNYESQYHINLVSRWDNEGWVRLWTTSKGRLIERARLTNDGNLGIGTLSPAARLDVAGSARVSSLQVTSLATGGTNYVCVDQNGNLTTSCNVIGSREREEGNKLSSLEKEVEELKRENSELRGEMKQVVGQLRRLPEAAQLAALR